MKILTWGIYLIIFCLPLYLVKFRIFGIPITVLELMIYALFIAWLVNRVQGLGLRVQVKKEKSLFLAIILIFIGVSLATIFSSDLRASAGIWKAWFIDPILFFIVVAATIKEKKQVNIAIFSLFFSGVAVSVISLIYLICGKLDPVGRLQAFYTSPNYLAMYLAPALIIGLFSKKIYFLIPSLLCAISLFFTYSYGAWLGIIAALGFGLVLYCLKLKKRESAVLVLCLFILAALFLGYFALNFRVASLNARLIIWQKSWEIFKTSPILGIGPGTFSNYFPQYPEWGVPQPHNIFLAFLLQTGIIGFAGFAWLLVWFYKKRTSTVLIAIMTCILVHGLVDTTYWKNDLSVIFWLIIALCYIVNHRVCSQKTNNPPGATRIDL